MCTHWVIQVDTLFKACVALHLETCESCMEVVVPSLNTLDGKHVYVYNIYYAETTLLD